ncbi:MAG: hypothetical protein C5B55_07030 [Blastocatellia bacterium]|nr:MAG: hypothetical protein C5B55_07030 [Blastocatellia bacterium]
MTTSIRLITAIVVISIVSSLFTASALAQGGLTLFGDVHITTDQGAAVPKDVLLILRKVTEGEIGRQTISNNGRYRFNNLKPGDYEIVVEVGGNEIGRLQQITVGGLSNSPYGYQYDLEFRWHSNESHSPGVVSAADVYDRPSSTKGVFQQAQTAVEKKKYDEAVKLLKRIVETDSADFQAWAALGTVYMVQQRFDDAEAAFQSSIEVRPTFSRAYFNLGKLRFSQKKFEEAVEPLTKAVELEPGSADSNLQLGECYLQLKKGSKAIPYLNEAARLGRPEAHLRLGWLYNAAGLKDRAAVEYEEFLKKKPDYPEREKLKEYIEANKKP